MNDRDNLGRFKKGFLHPRKIININLEKISKEHLSGKSLKDISKELGVSDRMISYKLKKEGYKVRSRKEALKFCSDKISKTLIRKGIQPIKRFSGQVWNKGLNKEDERVKNNIKGLLEHRKYQVFPKKDTNIEIKIQKFLEQLGIEYFTHKYIKEIKHSYQCDIFVPSMNLVIECDGNYWHSYPTGREIDNIRTKELIEKGFRVLRLWEIDISCMSIKEFKDKINYIDI